MSLIRLVLFLIVIVLGWMIGWSNATPITFKFLDWAAPSVPVAIMYFIFLFSGLILGVMLGLFVSRKKYRSKN